LEHKQTADKIYVYVWLLLWPHEVMKQQRCFSTCTISRFFTEKVYHHGCLVLNKI